MGNPNELDDADDIRVTLNMDDGNDIECRRARLHRTAPA